MGKLAVLLIAIALLAWSAAANAQTESEGPEPMAEEGADDAFLTGEGEEEPDIPPPAVEEGSGRAEPPDAKIYSVGLRWRWIMVPQWFVSMFGVDLLPDDPGGLLVSKAGFGPEFTYRKMGFDITAAIWFASLGWDGNVSFKGEDEEGNAWEVINNELKALLFTVDFLWSHSFLDWLAITWGAGLGAGIPIGEIRRTEATAASGGREKCSGPGTDPWCLYDPDDEQYNEEYKLPMGFVPWVNFLFGFRFKPHRHVAIYLDTGLGIGFQLGLRAGYVF
jgi:hypothetical protein